MPKTTEELRERIALVLYGDGDDFLWPRAVELADLILWEINEWEPDE